MTDYIRRERFLGTDKIIVGDKGTDLVLESIGKIYLKYGNSSKVLGDILKSLESAINTGTTDTLVITKGLSNLKFPGNEKFVYDTDSKILYLTTNEEYIELINPEVSGDFVKRSGDTMSGPLNIELEDTTESPLEVNSKVLVKNLNAQYINGETLEKYTKEDARENITQKWTFKRGIDSSEIISGDLISNKGFSPGLSGYGWKLDNSTSTLTIDNLIVRKVLTVRDTATKEVEQISRLRGISGNLWCSNSFIISYVNNIDEEELELSSELLINDYYTTTFTGDFYSIELEDSPFSLKINDILRCQRTQAEKIRYYDCIITNIDRSSIIVRLSETINDIYTNDEGRTKNFLSKKVVQESSYTESEDEYEEPDEYLIATPEIGDELVRIGNTKYGSTGLYLASIDDDSPAINLIENSTQANYQELGTLNSRIGVLSNINDSELLPFGIGIYTKNLFAKTGNWIIANGTIKHSNGIILQSNGQLEYINTNNPFGNNVTTYLDNWLNTKLEPINTAITNVNQEVTNLGNTVNDLNTTVTNLNNTVNNLNNEINGINQKIDNINFTLSMRVADGYLQYSTDGENYTNIVAISDLITKDLIINTLNSDSSQVTINHHWEFSEGVSNTKTY